MGTSETLQRQQIHVVTRCTFLQDNSGDDKTKTEKLLKHGEKHMYISN